MRKTKDFSKNNGITLIALVITIIVMLVLVAVTISMAVNGGLFNYAGRAAGETDSAIRDEQLLGSGGINVNGVWYNSIDEYLSGTPTQGDGKIEVVEPENIDDWEYTVEEDGTITLTMYKGSDTVVVIPNHINGIPVKKIGTNSINKDDGSLWSKDICKKNYYENEYYDLIETAPTQETITKVIVSEGIEIIDNRAFGESVALQDISLPSSVKSIGAYAFVNCENLTNIKIPSNVTQIGADAFKYSGLTVENIIFEEQPNVQAVEPENIDDWEYTVESDGTITLTKYKGSDTVVIIPNQINGIPVKKVGTNKVWDQWDVTCCTSLWSTEICDDYIEIDVYMHKKGQNTITKVIVSDGIEIIDDEAFRYSEALQEIILPSSLTDIGSSVFEDCTNLTTVKYKGFEGVWTMIKPYDLRVENIIYNYQEQ